MCNTFLCVSGGLLRSLIWPQHVRRQVIFSGELLFKSWGQQENCSIASSLAHFHFCLPLLARHSFGIFLMELFEAGELPYEDQPWSHTQVGDGMRSLARSSSSMSSCTYHHIPYTLFPPRSTRRCLSKSRPATAWAAQLACHGTCIR